MNQELTLKIILFTTLLPTTYNFLRSVNQFYLWLINNLGKRAYSKEQPQHEIFSNSAIKRAFIVVFT